MLHLHLSNRFERLEALLLERLAAHGDDPFEPDTEVTPEELHLVDTAIAYAAAHGASLAILSALEHSDTPLSVSA